MASKKNPSYLGELRQKAETRLKVGQSTVSASKPELQRLVHELEVHRIELEIQNEELRAARHETEQGLARYTALFDFAPIGYTTVSVDGNIREINHAGARLLDRSRRSLVGQKLERFVPVHYLDALQALLQTAFQQQESETAEFDLWRRDTTFTARVTAVQLEQAERTVLVAFEDVSEQRHRERQLADVERALREADRRKDEFLAVLSHELRNPLAPIRSAVHLLSRVEPGGERARRAQAVIDRQVTHLTRLIDDLLDVTRIARGKIQLQCECIDLVELVRRTVDDLRTSFEDVGIDLNVALSPDPFWVNADPARLVQIVSNVLGNAEKFTPRGGRVDVNLRRVGSAFELRVRDTGTGIAPDVLGHLFIPFAQAPQTMDRAHGGLGLGLAMVKGLVELHGGKVDIRSEGIGCGTELAIELPASECPAETAPEAEAPPPAQRRVLIIEDNVDSADSLMDVLVLSGHDVRTAHDGPSGLELARSFCPDVVICDIGLPQMDGYAVAHAFRADFALSDIYLVALSGYAQAEDARRASDAGFDRHIAKPPNLAKLDRILAEAPRIHSKICPPSSPSHSADSL